MKPTGIAQLDRALEVLVRLREYRSRVAFGPHLNTIVLGTLEKQLNEQQKYVEDLVLHNSASLESVLRQAGFEGEITKELVLRVVDKLIS